MRKIVKILPLLILALANSINANAQKKKEVFTVVIDVAHGGKDTGASVDGFTEKEITEKIASKIRELNKDSEIVFHFTREDDKYVSLQERVAIINEHKPDIVLSLHLNAAGNAEKYGMEFIVAEGGKDYRTSVKYAEMLADRFHKQHYTVDGVKEASFYILKNAESPTVFFELGYLTNEIDRVYLTSERSHEEIANTLLTFIKDVKNG